MKNWIKIVITCFVMGWMSLLWVTECRAWRPPVQEDEGAFLSWYEANKDIDGAVYSLSSDLALTRGSQAEPIRLDGQGAVTIDANSHGILIDSNVVLDNPKLNIRGNYFFLLMVRMGTELTLERGTLSYDTGDGVAIHVANGRIESPTGKGQVYLQAIGENVKGIQYDASASDTISNLSINVAGSGVAVGIRTDLSASLTIDNCDIKVSGMLGAYGVYGSAKTDFLITGSNITAESSSEEGERHSVYSAQGVCKAVDSKLDPELAADIPYVVKDKQKTVPVYVDVGTAVADWGLPATQDAFVRKGSADETISIPVNWNMPEQGFTKSGYKVVEGTYASECEQGTVLNPNRIVPRITVICLPPEKMFLVEYEIHTSEQKKGVQCLTPFPYGAERMEIEYSTDGTNFSFHKVLDIAWLSEQGAIPDGGLYGFYLLIPDRTKTVYLRATTYGESVFSGTSAVWTIEMDYTGSIPEDADDSGEGDRGGQGSNPSVSEEAPVSDEVSLENEASLGGTAGGLPETRFYSESHSLGQASEYAAASADSVVDGNRSAVIDSKVRESLDKKKNENTQAHQAEEQERASSAEGEKEKSGMGNILLVLLLLMGMAVCAIRYGKKVFRT